jgi:uncharacterized membrane protein YdfJ with MMPL/SSD domain
VFGKIARFSVRFRWFIIIFWIALVPVVNSAFPKIGDVTKNSVSDFLPKGSPTDLASKLEKPFQKPDTATNSVIVVERKNGTLTTADEAVLK